jgi:pimeloyl-ACP methyl ester carboxylesterase
VNTSHAFQPASVDAGGRRLAACVGGAGEPLVLLESGFGAPASDWRAAAEDIAGLTRVAWYERAGRGGSEPAPRPRRPDDLLADLRAVLRACGTGAPCILVGQSFGGLIARLYAHAHPQEVGGLVLVDSLHEDQFHACAPLLPPPFDGEPAQLTGMRRFWSGGWREAAGNEEGIDMVACLEAGRRVRSLGSLPVRILTASTWTWPPRLPPAVGQRLQQAWDSLQSSFEALSANTRREQLAQCGHFVQQDRPQAVVEMVRELVQQVRA